MCFHIFATVAPLAITMVCVHEFIRCCGIQKKPFQIGVPFTIGSFVEWNDSMLQVHDIVFLYSENKSLNASRN